jgi:hypothetical protein
VDDTLFHKAGRKVEGAGVFRDAVRSTVRRIVYALGLNLVVLTLRVRPPWGGRPIALPVNARLHRKNDETSTVEHAAAMLVELAAWLPDREFHPCGDGAYASRVRRRPAPHPHDVAGSAGTPRCMNPRRRAPANAAGRAPRASGCPPPPNSPSRPATATGKGWRSTCGGAPCGGWSWSATRSGYSVNKRDLLRLVIVRDPDGAEPDDFFVTTDRTATGAEIASRYAGRTVDRDLLPRRQTGPRRRGPAGPGNAKAPNAPPTLSLWLHALIWCWYLDTHPHGDTWIPRPRVHAQGHPELPRRPRRAARRVLWSQRITALSTPAAEDTKITDALLDTLAYAA